MLTLLSFVRSLAANKTQHNSLLDTVKGVAVDEVDLVVIQGQPSELVKHRVLKDTSQQIKNSERTKIGQDCTDLVATMEGTSGDGGDVVLVEVQVLQLPQLLQGT